MSFQEQLTKQAEKPFLFRTYKNLHRGADEKEREIDRNPGPAHDLPIWQVARATSAAPTYFKEVTIEKQRYLDGGFGANNPTVEIYEEVRRMNNNNDKSTGSIISIGTGKNNEQRILSRKDRLKELFKAGLGKYLGYINFAKKWATNSETAHLDMTRRVGGFPQNLRILSLQRRGRTGLNEAGRVERERSTAGWYREDPGEDEAEAKKGRWHGYRNGQGP